MVVPSIPTISQTTLIEVEEEAKTPEAVAEVQVNLTNFTHKLKVLMPDQFVKYVERQAI